MPNHLHFVIEKFECEGGVEAEAERNDYTGLAWTAGARCVHTSQERTMQYV
jgi:hypothetical protein